HATDLRMPRLTRWASTGRASAGEARASRSTASRDPSDADEQLRDLTDRFLGGGQSNSLEPSPGEHVEALEGKGKVRPSLVSGDRVDLVDDHGFRFGERLTALLCSEEDVERLGRRDQDVRRAARLH